MKEDFFSQLHKAFGTRGLISFLVLLLVLGGIGGVVLERFVFPFVSNWPVIRDLDLINPQAPIVITRREEVRINDGINQTDVVNKTNPSLVTLYLHGLEFTSPRFELNGRATGLIMTSDGLVVAPRVNIPRGTSVTAVLSDNTSYTATPIATDELMGLTYFKIDGNNLTVAKAAITSDLPTGERLIVVSRKESVSEPESRPAALVARVKPVEGFENLYNLTELATELEINLGEEELSPGDVLVNKDGLIVGLVVGAGQQLNIVPVEELRLSVDNYLADSDISWPEQNIEYQVFGPIQTKLLELGHDYGVRIISATGALKAGDFIFSVNGRDLSEADTFQRFIFSNSPGSSVNLKLIRAGQELEVEFSL